MVLKVCRQILTVACLQQIVVQIIFEIFHSDSIDKSLSIVIEGYICKHGVLCGYVRKYGLRSRDNLAFVPNEIHRNKLVYFGYHEGLNGQAIGPIYKMLFGGSTIISRHGSFSGNDIAYIYQNGNFAIKGSFDENSNLIKGQKVFIKKQECNDYGLKELSYSEPVEPYINYHYQPPRNTSFGDQPNIPDEVATEYMIIKNSPEALVLTFSSG